MNQTLPFALSAVVLLSACVPHNQDAHNKHKTVTDNIISAQRQALANNTKNQGVGPQSPRDIDNKEGQNTIIFGQAPASTQMNLCNIHFHKNAEHKAKDFSLFAGNGDGKGYQSGYKYSGTLSQKELAPVSQNICPSKHGALSSGDTIEVHYVYSSTDVKPGKTLGACLSDSIKNPQLRVETQVYVLVNDDKALDFTKLSQYGIKNGYQQALNIPTNTGEPVQYNGSTTGPGYNEKGSPFQVSWSVRPKVAKVNIQTVGQWCKGNVFGEDHAHGVRNLVKNPKLLSKIQ
ncbi:Uncharacterised protein [Phocoenobacter uteri]|uniref:Uncharacterized protein n=1 Tax=Phocoenobacter uteri TaxID=146806 RepID=A0A379C9V9_9PAST|nr:delta-class carbonic anhydrase [Phocoenobacter uteri]MDG6882290.1 hypothetical protein [Phocoenobacter uteri]SUB58447.1 Uncharacterised protein [Phocoenobacter uteri]